MSSTIKQNSFSIKPPGQQLKEKLIQRYGDLENAAHNLGLYKNTLEQYLRSSKLGSDSFKIKLTQLYNADFDSLYLDPKQQVSAGIDEAYKAFNNLLNNNLILLEELKQAASKYNLLKKYGYSVFLLGVQQNKEGMVNESVKNLCKAYTLFEEHQNKSMELATLLQLLKIIAGPFHLYHENNVPDYVHDILKKVHLVPKTYSEQVPLQTILKLMITKAKFLYKNTVIEEQRLHFLYFGNMGYAFGALEEYEESIRYNNNALLYATDKGSVPIFVNNGDACHNLGDLDQAFENYSKALSIIDGDDPRIYHIFIDIWDLLKHTGDISMANAYWDMIDLDKYFKIKHGFFHYFEQMILYGIQNNDEDFISKALSIASDKFSTNTYTENDTVKLMARIGTLVEANKFQTPVLKKIKAGLTRNFLTNPNLTESIRGAAFKLLGIIQFKTFDNFKS